jgi:hypothetical protein
VKTYIDDLENVYSLFDGMNFKDLPKLSQNAVLLAKHNGLLTVLDDGTIRSFRPRGGMPRAFVVTQPSPNNPPLMGWYTPKSFAALRTHRALPENDPEFQVHKTLPSQQKPTWIR